MSRLQFFIITSAVIFVLERILPALVSWPVFIFPVFVILLMLTSNKDSDELLYVAIVSFIFDFFSGYRLGFFTLAMLAVVLAIFLFKTRLNVDPRSIFSLAVYSLVFILLYSGILSTRSGPRLILNQAPLIAAETIILFFVFNLTLRKVKN